MGEVAEHFGCERPRPTDWSPELWPGRTGLVIRNEDGQRIIETMTWGLPPPLGSDPDQKPVTSYWHRVLWKKDKNLLGLPHRCLIVMDGFAFPDGPTGGRTRTWYGFEDRPIFAWAGVWDRVGRRTGYAGLLASASEPVSPGNVMPAIVEPDEYSVWLDEDLSAHNIALRSAPRVDMYREQTERPWGADRTP
nr:SOS response-associated peptidase family protein [Sphingopyxis sp. YR583]